MNDNKQSYKIERGIPMPPPISPNYPWRKMRVGDSFTVSLEKYRSLQMAASRMAMRTNMRFTLRRRGRKVRVWRIK